MKFLRLQIPLLSTVVVMVLYWSSSSSSLKAEAAQATPPIARPGCNDTCGNVSIPYPWGSGSGCFLDEWHEIECRQVASSQSNNASATKLPFLTKLGVELMHLPVGGSSNPLLVVHMPAVNVCSTTADTQPSPLDLRGGPYEFALFDTVFVLEGCSGSAVLVDESDSILTGCATICPHNNNTVTDTNGCYGVNCCRSPLSYYVSLQFFHIRFSRQSPGHNCLRASLFQSSYPFSYAGNLSSSDPFGAAWPIWLHWRWVSSSIKPDFNPHATCITDESSTRCYCKGNTIGSNPYVHGGCQVADVCTRCRGYCYGSDGYPFVCHNPPRFDPAAILGLSVSLGVVALLVGCFVLYRFIKRRIETKRRAKFFKRNGGLLLEQQLSSSVERTKIFSNNELEKATDHFSEDRILGQGGQGTVYKGMLSDGSIVAVKKSKLLDDSQLEQFINEVVILSGINHRHVVKVLGCCLETKVPVLVYEFVPNGTLYQHIHEHNEDFVLSWSMRMKVASDSAGAIAYLHSSSSVPVYHRDIKSSNILLDEKNRAKVSDFGSSKTNAIDETHLTTLVQGTMGYLDPEYFQSYQFTDKSDVYSFGVVLLELLTRKKPIFKADNMEQKNLVVEFLFLMENSRLYDILDPEIVKEGNEGELLMVANLAKRCLSWMGKMRPTMKEVAMALEMMINPPADIPLEDQQVEMEFEGFSEIVMLDTSDFDFISRPVSTGGT